MTARANFEKNCHAALTRYKQNIAEYTPPRVADPALIDALLKAADQYVRHAPCQECARREAIHEPLIEAVRAVAR